MLLLVLVGVVLYLVNDSNQKKRLAQRQAEWLEQKRQYDWAQWQQAEHMKANIYAQHVAHQMNAQGVGQPKMAVCKFCSGQSTLGTASCQHCGAAF